MQPVIKLTQNEIPVSAPSGGSARSVVAGGARILALLLLLRRLLLLDRALLELCAELPQRVGRRPRRGVRLARAGPCQLVLEEVQRIALLSLWGPI